MVNPHSDTASAPRSQSAAATATNYRGHVSYLYAFDVAYDMRREPLRTLLGHEVTPLALDLDKRQPRDLFFHRPQVVNLPSERWDTPLGAVDVRRTIKLYPVGAISIAFHVPVEAERLDQLIDFHDLPLAYDSAHELGAKALEELRPYLMRGATRIRDDEAYTVFALEWPLPTKDGAAVSAEEWLQQHRNEVANLLAQETATVLSRQQIQESTSRSLSYYVHDLVVIDWDAALLVDRPGQFRTTLEVMELANVQLAELEAYDRILDEALQQAYHNLAGRHIRRRAAIKNTLREFRIDMARLADELSNTTKFFGDWNLARLYKGLYDRFHLGDWQGTVNSKLKTLDELYEIHKQDQVNIWMVVLEFTIVLLFVLDLIILYNE